MWKTRGKYSPFESAGRGGTLGERFGLAHSSNGLWFLDDFSKLTWHLGHVLLDSFSVFKAGSFDVTQDFGGWLLIVGQQKIASAAHNMTLKYFLIIDFPKFDPLTATEIALWGYLGPKCQNLFPLVSD